MKFFPLILFAFFLFPGLSNAQSKAKIQKKFLAELNTIIKNSKEHHWNYSGEMSVDSAFAINKNGILSVTVSYKTDSSSTRVRMEAPVNKIKSVDYDRYLILFFKENEVTVFESEKGSTVQMEPFKTNLFHIGIPSKDGFYERQKLQDLLEKLRGN